MSMRKPWEWFMKPKDYQPKVGDEVYLVTGKKKQVAWVTQTYSGTHMVGIFLEDEGDEQIVNKLELELVTAVEEEEIEDGAGVSLVQSPLLDEYIDSSIHDDPIPTGNWWDNWGPYKGKNRIKSSPNYKTFKLCEHFMDEFKLDDQHTVYLSSLRGLNSKSDKKSDKPQPTKGFYLDSGWIQEDFLINPELSGIVNGYLGHTLDLSTRNKSIPPSVHLKWRDMGVVTLEVLDTAVRTCMYLISKKYLTTKIGITEIETKRVSERLEIACYGGHGRTGTLLACLLVSISADNTAKKSIDRVRKEYCDSAIETKTQEDLIKEYYKIKWEIKDGGTST